VRCNGYRVVFGEVDFMDCFFQRGEILLNGLVNENVPVGKIQDLFLHTAFQQTIYSLESNIRFAGAGRHDEKNSLLSSRNCIHGAVDSVPLIIARSVGRLAGVVGLVNDLFLLIVETFPGLIPGNQLIVRRELRQGKLSFLPGQKIMLIKSVTIRTVCKRHIQHLRVSHGLL